MKLYTIGFTKKTAEQFFTTIRGGNVKRVIDIRLNNVSQLAGFSKRDDLRYFLREICQVDYAHLPELAPTPELLDAIKGRNSDWEAFEREFVQLMASRRIDEVISPELLSDGCLLCSEESPRHCHRRLVAEYLRDRWGNVEIVHIV